MLEDREDWRWENREDLCCEDPEDSDCEDHEDLSSEDCEGWCSNKIPKFRNYRNMDQLISSLYFWSLLLFKL